MSTKGQNNARQPVARVKGRESTSQRRQPDAARGNAPQQQGRGKPGGFGKPRNPQEAGGKPQGRRPAAPRDAYGNLMQPQAGAAPHESAPLFKMSRAELAQLELQRQARGLPRDENGEPNGNVAEPKNRPTTAARKPSTAVAKCRPSRPVPASATSRKTTASNKLPVARKRPNACKPKVAKPCNTSAALATRMPPCRWPMVNKARANSVVHRRGQAAQKASRW
jgi:23S rRNA pseudouridine2605 synthase